MLTSEFASIDPTTIVVDRENRQRRKLVDIDDLMRSITRVGLIHPPIVDRGTLTLRTGERRLTAVLGLGWTSIPVQYSDELDEHESQILELEENISRVDIDWQDQALAINHYHNLLMENPEWNMTSTAEQLGMSKSTVGRWLLVAEELLSGNAKVQTSDKFSTAFGLASRTRERQKDEELDSFEEFSTLIPEIPGGTDAESTSPLPPQETAKELDTKKETRKRLVPVHPFLNGDFNEWARTYSGPKYNFIHCDFPYGVGADTRQQAAVTTEIHGTYADTEATYFKLLTTLLEHADNFISKKAHIMFWFSMDYYTETVLRFEEAGWHVNPFPLVWYKSDNAGILPDAKRGPRRTYETALLINRGDKLIVRAKSNTFGAPGRPKENHMSEKPIEMLEHFFSMFVDESTHMLDPTAGSGNAVQVADSYGAKSILGIELSEEFYQRAVDSFNKYRQRG